MKAPITTEAQQDLQYSLRVFGIGSIALAGFIGGPIAAACLVITNTQSLVLQRQTKLAVAFFTLATVTWAYTLLHVPPDFISQLVAHIPQALVWWLFSFWLLRRHNETHKVSGGCFRSAWLAAGIGLVVSVGVRVVSFLVASALS